MWGVCSKNSMRSQSFTAGRCPVVTNRTWFWMILSDFFILLVLVPLETAPLMLTDDCDKWSPLSVWQGDGGRFRWRRRTCHTAWTCRNCCHANRMRTDVHIIYLASLPSAISLRLSILARLRSTSPNYNIHGGNLKFWFIYIIYIYNICI